MTETSSKRMFLFDRDGVVDFNKKMAERFADDLSKVKKTDDL